VASSTAASAGIEAGNALGGGVVGPMGSAGGGLSLPGVEKVMAEMEGGSAEDMKEKFARLGMGRRVGGPPIVRVEGAHQAFRNRLGAVVVR
jgi:hypothetical protein